MPEGMNQQVNQQLFLTSVIGEQVLILNSGVEKDDSLTNTAKYLTAALSSLKVSGKSILLFYSSALFDCSAASLHTHNTALTSRRRTTAYCKTQ
jgi:hypothetical protein